MGVRIVTLLEVCALPCPTGTFGVGRTAVELIDPSRPETYSDDAAGRRELVIWIWYPTDGALQGDAVQRADLFPPTWRPNAEAIGLDVVGVRSHAIGDATLAAAPRRHPVLILSPSGFSPLLHASVAEELASWGYVVVGVNHTYESPVTPFVDGRIAVANPDALAGSLAGPSGSPADAFRRRAVVCETKADDLRSVVDFLTTMPPGPSGLGTDRLDLDRIGAFGHSFGGNAALEWCRTDDRCVAAANMDGALWTAVGTIGLQRPALLLLADHPELDMSGEEAVAAGLATDAEWHDAEREITLDGWRAVDALARPGRTVHISGATHVSFMDVAWLPMAAGPAAALLAASSIDRSTMWRLTSDLLLAFFGHHLNDTASSLETVVSSTRVATVGAP